MQSDSPRTDAAVEWYLNERNTQIKYVHVGFARQLERELAEAQKQLETAINYIAELERDGREHHDLRDETEVS